ncbi:MAG: radical SAM family heme chaperone HemW [Clostridiales bacterium]|nr:radical SAM family heme chaperone HemW [Clostridiales bacterium]
MEKRIGIYFHIPFCASRCAYCDFCSTENRRDLIPAYQEAIIAHLEEYAPRLKGYYVDTVYFGGGTPSWYGAKNLIKIFDALKRCCKVLVDAEVTLEANPDSIREDELRQLRKTGFNRVSIGVQSFNDEILKFINRRHNSDAALDAFEAARRAGFENISLDLIYGLPAQSREDWSDTLMRAVLLGPEHISCYGLKIEEGTRLWQYRGTSLIPDDDAQADMYLYTVDFLASHGYAQYEISNFAQRGKESRHNLKYWLLGDYAGFGASAASLVGSTRYTFTDSVEEYISAVKTGAPVIRESEEISIHERSAEYIMLGMRTTYGISAADYETFFRGGFEALEPLLRSYQKYGYARETDGRWSFTPKGFLISNSLIGELLDALTEKRYNLSVPWKQEDYYSSLF